MRVPRTGYPCHAAVWGTGASVQATKKSAPLDATSGCSRTSVDAYTKGVEALGVTTANGSSLMRNGNTEDCVTITPPAGPNAMARKLTGWSVKSLAPGARSPV